MDQQTNLFSIITVCLNPGTVLEPTVASVVGQEFRDYELLIKDGGSTDGTEKRTWSDSRIRFLSSPDTGIYDAMNQALTLARGEFVCFLNAGDHFIDSKVLSDMARATKADPDAVLLYGDVFKGLSRSNINIYPDRLSRFYLFTRMICHQCWFVKRSTYLAYGGFEGRSAGGADYALLLKMLVRDRLKYRHVQRVVVYYEGGGHSANPAVLQGCAAWHDEIRRELFTPGEYRGFTLIWKLWSAVKPGLYDICLSWLWRPIQCYRHRRNNDLIRKTHAMRQ